MAVYTTLSNADIARLLAEYGAGPLARAEGIAEGVENTNYLLAAGEEGALARYILTLYEKRVRRADLPFFLGLMEHLAERGIPCPLPVHRRDGALISELKGKPAALVTFLEGSGVRRPEAAHLEQVGETMARMHRAAEGFALSRPNDLSPFALGRLYAGTADGLDEVRPGLKNALGREAALLEEHAAPDIPRGVIHADLFPDNVFFQDGRLSGIIDFYFACNDYLMYDLAVCINAWCFDEETWEFDAARARSLLRAYGRVRNIAEAEMEALPVLCRGGALRFLLTRAHDRMHRVEGALVRVKDPLEYVKKWEFHRRVAHHREYGF